MNFLRNEIVLKQRMWGEIKTMGQSYKVRRVSTTQPFGTCTPCRQVKSLFVDNNVVGMNIFIIMKKAYFLALRQPPQSS
jgi:hypothetical protein